MRSITDLLCSFNLFRLYSSTHYRIFASNLYFYVSDIRDICMLFTAIYSSPFFFAQYTFIFSTALFNFQHFYMYYSISFREFLIVFGFYVFTFAPVIFFFRYLLYYLYFLRKIYCYDSTEDVYKRQDLYKVNIIHVII